MNAPSKKRCYARKPRAHNPWSRRVQRRHLRPIEVPADRLWGAQTERARRNFNIGEERMPIAIIHALAIIKRAAAEATMNSDCSTRQRANAIASAAQR